MTTVACTETTMAADSLATDDCTKSSVVKIFRIKRRLIGVSGSYSACMAFVHWLKDGADQEDIPDMDEVYALALSPEGIFIYDGHPRPYKLNNTFAAVGSGSQAALAAMHCGRTPREAVKVAAKVDPSTGGRVIEKKL